MDSRSSETNPMPDGTTSPVAGIAITHFDGAGKLTQKDFTVTGGLPSPANGNAATGFHFAGGETGTYLGEFRLHG